MAAQVLDQLKGLSFGRRLSWYLENDAVGGSSGTTVIWQRSKTGRQQRRSADIIAGGGTDLRVPGMYSLVRSTMLEPTTSLAGSGTASNLASSMPASLARLRSGGAASVKHTLGPHRHHAPGQKA